MQLKAALGAAFDVLEARGRDLPVLVSVTMETTGTMLVGTSLEAIATTVEPFPIFSLGLNCATGPERMGTHIAWLGRHWPGRISVIPNAGLPEVKDGRAHYPLSPAQFGRRLTEFVSRYGVSIVGGCCGTTPAHIQALVQATAGIAPARRNPAWQPALSSLYHATEIEQSPRPLMIGERMNTSGSRRFRRLLLEDDFTACARIGLEQEQRGAHVLDVCTAYAGRDERADMEHLVRLLVDKVRAPLVIDSTSPEVLEVALEASPGRCLINSINLEDGGTTANRVLGLAKRHGAAVLALTIDRSGMAMTAEKKLAVAKELYALAVGQHGLRPADLFFDALTFTIGSGDPSLRTSALETLEAIRRIKAELPGVHTSLGLSNISFGLPPAARRILNSVFLHEALGAGLDAAIVDAGNILPLVEIKEDDRKLCLDLLLNRSLGPEASPLERFLAHFAGRQENKADDADPSRAAEQALEDKLRAGHKEGVDDLLAILLLRHSALDIVNRILVPGMRRIGELFGKGEMLLPFVLQSAEVMKHAVSELEPHMTRAEGEAKTSILLATVQGDVHDIGKNLVDIILSNNGYRVVNLGINVPTETIIEQARVHQVQVVGLSGLLVKSAIAMQEAMPRYKEAGLDVPILLGGAALTRKFVAEACVPGYHLPVVYCADAFAGLKAMQDFEAGTLTSTAWTAALAPVSAMPGPKEAELNRDILIPTPAFQGARQTVEIDPALLLAYLNKQALFRGRWGYRRGKLSASDYAQLIEGKAEPLLAELSLRAVHGRLVTPKATWGWFPCHREGDAVVIADGARHHTLAFPRQKFPPELCIADYFRTAAEGGDVAGFFVVTIGPEIMEAAQALFAADRYHDYLMLHGFAVELTDALAEHWHERMRGELGFPDDRPADVTGYVTQGYRGSRYGFGYPACPDLEAHRVVFELLNPDAIGVALTENMQMVPEVSTSAIVVHHPQAKYFAV